MRTTTILTAALANLLLCATDGLAGDLSPSDGGVAAASGGDRHYAIFFAYQAPDNRIELSHTFALFVRTAGDGASRRITESHTISWFPVTEIVSLARPAETGMNMSLEQTLGWAEARNLDVTVIGPYEIEADLFGRAATMAERLNRGELKYKAFDRFGRNKAKNCIHAVSDIDEDRGQLGTGGARGLEATEMVVRHLSRHFKSTTIPDAGRLLAALKLDRYVRPTTAEVAAK
jgi:hypothetical protein